MRHKNISWTFLLFIALSGFIVPGRKPGTTETRKWVVSESSNLSVNGTTNINKFACEIPAYDRTDTLFLKNKSDKEVALSGNIDLKVQSFDCHNSIMTHDLRKTLKETQFPLLHISFLSLNKLPVLTAGSETITGLVDIEIAGVRKRVEVNYQISEDAQKIIHLLGSRDVNFSDFNLVPPRKLGGMIQTNDKLSVGFHLKIKQLD